MPDEYVAVNITKRARSRVRSLTFALTGAVDRRVTMSEAILAACAVAEQLTPGQLAEHLPTEGESS